MELQPVVLEHAAAFIGRSPWEVSRDADLLADAQLAAWECYHHAHVVAGIDVYHLEVEAWGVTVEAPTANSVPSLGPPTVADPCALRDLPTLDIHRDGRLPLTLTAATRLRAAGAPVSVPMAGPVSIAAGLLGFESMLMALLTDTETMQEVLLHLARHQVAVARQWRAAGFRTVIYESAGGPPLVSPATFAKLVAPALAELFAAVPMPCILGGDTARIAKDLLATGPSAVICPAETDQAAFLATVRAWPQVVVRVNLPATALADGNLLTAQAAVSRAAALAGDQPGVVLGTGVLPYGADPAFISALCAWNRERG